MKRLRASLLALLIAGAAGDTAVAATLIGVAGPTEGPYASVTHDVSRAAQAAARQINADGGVAGAQVEIVEADDGCAEAASETAAREFVAKGVVLVVGHPCGAAAIAAAKIYAQAGVVFIAPATRAAALTVARAGPTIFRLSGRDDRQGAEAGAYIARAFAGKPIAIVQDGSKFARGLAGSAAAALKGAGMTNVLSLAIVGGQKDYTKLIDKLRAAKIEAVYYAGYAIEGGQLLRQMRAAGFDAAFIGSDTLATEPFADAAGDKAVGAQVLLPHEAVRTVAEAARRERFDGQTVTSAFAAAYAAVEAWAAAARRANTTTGPAVSEVLTRDGAETVLGRVHFDAKGDAEMPSFDVLTWRDGAWHTD
jgi:branched-chain amino acid transport system substrate-binding protein